MEKDQLRLVKIDKLDAIKKQLETAIWLFLNDKDPVSVHTLASAVRTMLRDIAKSKGIPDSYQIHPNANDVSRKKLIEVLHKPQNFFKHAKKDSDEVLIFNPDLNIFFLVEAIGIYEKLSDASSSLMHAFSLWFYTIHKDKFPHEETPVEVRSLADKLNPDDKKSFLNLAACFENLNMSK